LPTFVISPEGVLHGTEKAAPDISEPIYYGFFVRLDRSLARNLSGSQQKKSAHPRDVAAIKSVASLAQPE